MSPLSSFLPRAFHSLGRRPLLVFTLFAGLGGMLFLARGPQQEAEDSVGQSVAYDDEGQLVQTTDAAGRITQFTVTKPDKEGRRQRIRKLPDGSEVTEELDKFGRRVSMTDAAGTVAYDYDGFSYLTTVRRSNLPPLSFAHYPSGQLKSIKLGDRLSCDYRYDLLGRLVRIESRAGVIDVEYAIDGKGGKVTTWRYPNGLRTVLRQNAANRLQSITHLGPQGQELAKFTYAYLPDGLVREVWESWPNGQERRTYEYDDMQRLAAVIDSRRGTTSYRYDQVGNRVEVVSSSSVVSSRFDWAGRLVHHLGGPCSHDAAGSLTAWVRANGPVRCLFNAENALAAVERMGSRVDYRHDGDGRLHSRTGKRKTEFVVDPESDVWRPLLAQDTDGRKTLFVWVESQPVAAHGDDGPEFYLADRLGSVRLVANQRGEVRRLDYDPFGMPQEEQAGHELRPGFAGLFYDPEAGLYLTGARAYAPDLGRFLQIDPIHHPPLGSPQDLSAYAYCGNDPINFTDRNGAQSEGAEDDDLSLNTIFKEVGRDTFENIKKVRKLIKVYEIRGKWTGGDGEETTFDWFYSKDKAQAEIDRIYRDYYGGLLDAAPSKPTGLYIHEKDEDDDGDSAGPFGLKVFDSVDKAKDLVDNFKDAADDPVAYLSKKVRIPSPLEDYKKNVEDRIRDVDTLNTGMQKLTRDITNAQFNKINRLLRQYNRSTGGYDGSSYRYGRPLGGSWYRPSFSRPAHPRFHSPSFYRPSGGSVYSPPSGGGYYPSNTSSPSLPSLPGTTPGALPLPPPLKSTPSTGDRTVITYDENAPSNRRLSSQSVSGGYGDVAFGGRYSSGPGTTTSTSPMSPAPVGGIRLAGAAASLRNLGSLKGVAVDPAGRLVLIADDRKIDLPALRLDDVVTVFRCVYLHGEAPFVSIDPDPADPEWKVHSVRHDKGTKDTYVGWVLFEADRIMKCYGVGKDNLTGKRIQSRVPSYRDKIGLMFDLDEEVPSDGSQYRNWIVPSGAVRRRSPDGKLTLLDVPLVVRTERTVVREGKIVDAPELGRSRSAELFVQWFTDHYDAISDEWESDPPDGSGVPGPVHVFAELKRVAMIAAVAESLRAQGVPLPAWMRDYPVRACKTPPTTPGVSRSETRDLGRTRSTRMSKGGCEMSPPTAKIETVEAPELARLAPRAAAAAAAAPCLTPVSFEHEGQRYHAVALPGAGSGELGGLHLAEADVILPLDQDESLRLPRYFDSFFDPEGDLGRGWTFNLPRLEEFTRVTSRDVKTFSTMTGLRLTSPLDADTDFSTVGEVPEVGIKMYVPDQKGPILGITGLTTDERIGMETRRLLWRDGRRWHFDKDGRLRGQQQGPVLRVFHYDEGHRLDRVEGWVGKENRAALLLAYDGQNRLREVRGRRGKDSDGNDATALYSYEGGRLQGVKIGTRTVEYRYTPEGLLAAVLVAGKEVRGFEYAQGGQLKAERVGNSRIIYEVERDAAGVRVVARQDGATRAEARYDSAGRLLKSTLPNGTSIDCAYDAKGDLRATLAVPGGLPLVLKRSADGRREQLQLATGGELQTEHDEAGRPRSIAVGGEKVLDVAYTHGVVESLKTDRYNLRPFYRQDGEVSGLRIRPLNDGIGRAGQEVGIDLDARGRVSRVVGPDGQWLEVRYDDQGSLKSVSGPEGETRVRHDARGRLESMTSTEGEITMQYDDKGRLTRVAGPGGVSHEKTFDPTTGRLQRIQTRHGKSTEVMELDRGLPVRIRKLDRSQTRFEYESVGESGRRLRSIRLANGLTLGYEYNDAGQLAAVSCGSIYRLAYAYDDAGRMVSWKITPPQGPRGPWQ